MSTLTRKSGLLRRAARALRLGTAAVYFWHNPVGLVRRVHREGAANLWLAARGRTAMERAVSRLPALMHLEPAIGETRELHFLTGRNFWYQTAFCAHSFMWLSQQRFRLVIYDDGSLQPAHVARLRALFGEVDVLDNLQIEQRLDRVLPAGDYPLMRSRRIEYPNLRKMTDVHAGLEGWKLLLDSDMIFFRRPDFLLEWLREPRLPLYMVDVKSSYGYSMELMQRLCGHPIPERLNVGIIGLQSSSFDWRTLEEWSRALFADSGTSYYQEQALTAMFLAGRPCSVAPEQEYVCLPAEGEARRPTRTLHHYVAESKNAYFRHGWRAHLERIGVA